MIPTKFQALAQKNGELKKYSAGQVFHSQDFPKKLFLIKSGYVKRYQSRNVDQKVLELIYGPDHIVSLSQLYKTLFGIDQNQDNFLYVYQALTDVEMLMVSVDTVQEALAEDPLLYQDFFYESGIKLRSNIARLASNSIHGTQKKIAHQLVSLAYEFGGLMPHDSRNSVALPLPQSATDIAEQLNISVDAVQKAFDRFIETKLISIDNDYITLLDLEYLRDVYL